jgi:transcriptional regulator with XRE-family HTH domain
MSIGPQGSTSPQARGRELASQGRKLWAELGSVKSAAADLMSQYRDVPSLQAYRYAAGLSQDQAAMRYNEVTEHQTSLGGTSINAWETWARRRGQGSPPSFSSLLILSIAYGRGPLGVAEEKVPPGDLVAEAYERLPIEDQISLKNFAPSSGFSANPDHSQARREKWSLNLESGRPLSESTSQIGDEFILSVPTVEYGNSEIGVFSLPNPQSGQLLDLEWRTFGFGVERLSRQIKNLGRRLDADICFGVNEAGLVMATFLSSARFSRCAIGYLRCNKTHDGIDLDKDSLFPAAAESPVIVICDFEVKHADVIGYLTRQIRSRYPDAELYFAVFGAMTKAADLRVASFDDLTGAQIMRKADFSAVFIAATMSPPGIEPPLELR